MKARVRKTGEIIDVKPIANPCAQTSTDNLYSSNYDVYYESELDFLNVGQKVIDWEQRRYELAKAAMQGFCANSGMLSFDRDSLIALSVEYADAFIAELKKEKK